MFCTGTEKSRSSQYTISGITPGLPPDQLNTMA
jgi:hypothetical protein